MIAGLSGPRSHSPILCHGIAGVLLLVRGFVQVAPEDPLFERMQDDLLCLLLSMFDPCEPSGFRGGDHQSSRELLEGSAGVLACLATQMQAGNTASPLSLPFLLTDGRSLIGRGACRI